MPDAMERLVRRYARTHGPFETDAAARPLRRSTSRRCSQALERAGELVRGELRPGGTQREWCDPEVLRRLRRASLAALRKEIEPADQRALARFLPELAGRRPPPGRAAPGVDRLREVLVAAAGPRAARRRVGARRAAAPRRRLLAVVAGPAVRGGRARVGRRGRARPPLRPRRALLPRGRRRCSGRRRRRGEAPAEPRARRDPRAPAPPAPASSPTCSPTSPGIPTEELQEALWDLVWAGEVTNDAFAPLRSPRARRAPWSQQARADRRRALLRPPHAARSRRSRAAGRSTASLFAAPTRIPTARRRTQAELLLERYGIVTREQVLAEGIPGGFSSLYDQFAALETVGVAPPRLLHRGPRRRAVRAARARSSACARSATTTRAPPIVLAATDPAQPYGAVLQVAASAKAARPRAPAGAYVVLAGAEPVLYVERGGKGLQILVDADDPRARRRHSRRSPTPSTAAASSAWRSSASTASRSSARAWEERAARARLPRRPAQAHADGVAGARAASQASSSAGRQRAREVEALRDVAAQRAEARAGSRALSTPSATTSRPRLRREVDRRAHDRGVARRRRPCPMTNERSILSSSTGSCLR